MLESLSLAWFPRNELDEALTLRPTMIEWPYEDYAGYCRHFEERLRQTRADGASPLSVSAVVVDDYLNWCAEHREDPADPGGRARYAAVIASRGEAIPCPPICGPRAGVAVASSTPRAVAGVISLTPAKVGRKATSNNVNIGNLLGAAQLWCRRYRARVAGGTRIVLGAALVASTLSAAGCGSGCKSIRLAAEPALHGDWIVVKATSGGNPLRGVHLGVALLERPGGRPLFEDTVVTGTTGVARLDPVLDGMGPYRKSAHVYQVVPAGNTFGKSDDGYCSSASATAPFEYVEPP